MREADGTLVDHQPQKIGLISIKILAMQSKESYNHGSESQYG